MTARYTPPRERHESMARTYLRMGQRHHNARACPPINDNPDAIFDDCGVPGWA